MEFFKFNKVYDLMGKSKMLLLVSTLVSILAIALLFVRGLNYGIDFAGGTLVQIKYNDGGVSIAKLRSILDNSPNFGDVSITETGVKGEFILRFASATSNVVSNIAQTVQDELKNTGNIEIRRVDIVGPRVGSELREKSLIAIALSIIAILIYVALRFEFRFALAAIIASIHDVLITVGAVSLFKIDVNLDTLAAFLTLIGYSLNDTIIIFDRIREDINKTTTTNLSKIINIAVSQTLSRTTLTSLATLFVVATLYLFGGDILRGFSFPLLIGIIAGTYSSIFIASAVLPIFRFSVVKYRKKEALKLKRIQEKKRMRALYDRH